ncbi:hypothetical protein KKC59_04500, partial [bacterium]|nr:hypothetical protein [bacterium]
MYNFFKKRSIAQKLGISFFIITFFSFFIGLTSLYSNKKINDMVNKGVSSTSISKDLSLVLEKISSEFNDMLNSEDKDSVQKINNSISDGIGLFKNQLLILKKDQYRTGFDESIKKLILKLDLLLKKKETVFYIKKQLIEYDNILNDLNVLSSETVQDVNANIASIVDENAFLVIMSGSSIDESQKKVEGVITNFTQQLFPIEKSGLFLNLYLANIKTDLINMMLVTDFAKLVPIQDAIESYFLKAGEQISVLKEKISDDNIRKKLSLALVSLDECKVLAVGKSNSVFADRKKAIIEKS